MKCMGFLFKHIKNNEFKLTEILNPDDWGYISKVEEEQGFNDIKRKWVPKAVELWNKKHRKHKVTVDEVLKGLRKVRHDSRDVPRDAMVKWKISDIIHYQYKVPNTRESMTFMIHRTHGASPYKDKYDAGILMAGFFSGTALFEEPV